MRTRIARLVGVLVVCLALVGCMAPSGPQAGSIVGTAKDDASVVTCKTNRAQLAQQYTIMLNDAPDGSADFDALVTELGVKCPSGGTYSWNAGTTKVVCSVHGE
jgi:hypothetical protein